jgi:hypothetical protein
MKRTSPALNVNIKKMFNSFYFLHPHKTAGMYIYKNILFQIEKYLNKNNIKILNNPINDSMPHYGWHPEITEKTYILASFREPVYQVISLYASHGNYTKDYLITHLDDENSPFFNNQSKSLCFDANLEDFAKQCKQPDLDLAISRAKRINKVINPAESINNVELCIYILKQFGITNYDNIILNKEPFNVNKYSNNIYNSLTESEKSRIIERSNVDYAVYNMLQNG